jgi:hypothetical protein
LFADEIVGIVQQLLNGGGADRRRLSTQGYHGRQARKPFTIRQRGLDPIEILRIAELA